MIWTEEAVARLRELRAEGMSNTAISRVFGTTRNAIIGKCRRLELPMRVQAPPKPKWKAPKIVSLTPQPPTPYSPPPPPRFDTPHEPVATIDLKRGQCRYVVSEEDKPFEHCGRDGFPWCSSHAARIFSQQKRA